MNGIFAYSERREINKTYLFYLAYIFLIVKEICLKKVNISDVVPSAAINVISMICFLGFWSCIVAILIFFEQYTTRRAVVYLMLFGIFALSMHTCGSTSSLTALAFILCSRSIDFDKFGKMSFKLFTAILLITAVLAMTGVIGMGIRYRSVGDPLTRYAMGFNHPNTLALLSFQWLSLLLYLYRAEKDKKRYIIYVLVAIAVYLITNGNTFLITSVMLLVLELGYRLIQKIFKISEEMQRVIACVALISAFIVSMIVIRHFWIDPTQLEDSLKTFMARFTLSKKYITAYGLHLFGSHIVTGSFVEIPGFAEGYFFLDNGYVRVLVESGILVAICAVFAVLAYIRALIKERSWEMVIITVCLLFYTFCEAKVATIPFNLFLINIGVVLLKNNEKRKLEQSR